MRQRLQMCARVAESRSGWMYVGRRDDTLMDGWLGVRAAAGSGTSVGVWRVMSEP